MQFGPIDKMRCRYTYIERCRKFDLLWWGHFQT